MKPSAAGIEHFALDNAGGAVITTVQTMPTEIKVRKVGNSLGLLLPKEVAQELDVEEGASLFLCRAPEGRFYLTPYDPEFEKQMAVARKGMRRYRNTLRELAK
jgi:putative addiction module antidote